MRVTPTRKASILGGLEIVGIRPLLGLFWTVLIFFGVALMFFFIIWRGMIGAPVARTAAVVGTAAVVTHGVRRREDRRDDRREDRAMSERIGTDGKLATSTSTAPVEAWALNGDEGPSSMRRNRILIRYGSP